MRPFSLSCFVILSQPWFFLGFASLVFHPSLPNIVGVVVKIVVNHSLMVVG
jgi:hypothetical protein